MSWTKYTKSTKYKALLLPIILSLYACSANLSDATSEQTNSSTQQQAQTSGNFEDNEYLATGIKNALFKDCTSIPEELKKDTPKFVDYWYLNDEWKVFQFGPSYMLISQYGDFGPDIEDEYQLTLHESWGCAGTEHFITGLQPTEQENDSTESVQIPTLQMMNYAGKCYRFSQFRGCRFDFVLQNSSDAPILVFGNIFAKIDGSIYMAETSRTGEILYIEKYLNPNQYIDGSAYFFLEKGQYVESLYFGPEPEIKLADASSQIDIKVNYNLEWDYSE
jgi:hypothetical protein